MARTRYPMVNATAAQLAAANPILPAGVEARETDTKRRKVGDGVTAYNSLAYDAAGNVSSVAGRTGDVVLVDTDLYDPRPNQQGLLGWSYQPELATANTAVTAGVEQLTKVRCSHAGNATKVIFGVSATPSGCTNSYVGIRDMTGALIAVSADLSTTFNAAGTSTEIQGTVPSTALVAGTDYYAVLLIGAGTLSLVRGVTNGIVNSGLSSGAYKYMTAGSGLTSLPSSLTLSGASKSNTSYYAAFR